MRSSTTKQVSIRKWAIVLSVYMVGVGGIALGDAPTDPTRPTPAQIERDKQRQKDRSEKAAKIPMIQLSPEQAARELQWEKDHAGITLRSNGKTLPGVADGSKGSIFLDDEKYPVGALALTCDPKGAAALGEPIYGGRGPNLYPVGIVSLTPGKCVLKNRDFAVTIVIRDIE